jgi:thiol-disulfide isomerase/thioredoxin
MRKAVRLTLFISFILLSAGVQAQVRAVKITEVEKMIAESKTPLIINCWATWCKPCVEEIPYFIEETNKRNNQAATSDSVSLVLVSLDFKESFPATLFINNKTGYRKFYEEQLSHDELKAEMKQLLK